MKIVFFGSDDFAAAHLLELFKAGYDVCACVTQPDRPKGRGMKVIMSPIKEIALEKNIPLLQPTDIHDENLATELKKFEATLFIVIAYGRILPATLLAIPEKCAINVHGSLLPQYRGAAPINWTIINGDKETGLSIIRMSPAMDGGDIISTVVTPIEIDETSQELRIKMIKSGKHLLVKTVADLLKDDVTYTQQDMNKVTKAPKLSKQLGQINWNKSALAIHNLVRGLHPWPYAFTQFKDKNLKIITTQLMEENEYRGSPGEVVAITKSGFVLMVADNQALLIKKVHLESAKAMDAYSFVQGHNIKLSYVFESQVK